MLRRLHGHFWTLAPFVKDKLRPPRGPSTPFVSSANDPVVGPVAITGKLHMPAGNAAQRTLIIGVHGLGGSADSGYLVRFAALASAAGYAFLRVSLRGASLDGEDVHHGGLTDDLRGVLASPALAAFDEILLVGFSLGGHLVLRYAAEEAHRDPRVHAVAAICPPLDLARSVVAIDAPGAILYRQHLLRGLVRLYTRVVARGRAHRSADLATARRIRTIRAWDENIIVPRFGFRTADDYYAQASVAALLHDIRVPTLVLQAERDPMVTAPTVRDLLACAPSVETRWLARGGHVSFPPDTSLGEAAPLGLEPQVLAWLVRHARQTPQPGQEAGFSAPVAARTIGSSSPL